MPTSTDQPVLRSVFCPGAAALGADAATPPGHRIAYWEWNATGNPQHPHVIVCVHGLSRQGRDFDTLARALSRQARIVCPDVVGRGQSDWLQNPQLYQVPQYAADMLALLAQLHGEAPIATLDWVGTSMGGLIGMTVCGHPGLPLPAPVRRLVLNDVGPVLAWTALERIGRYLGQPVQFDSLDQAAHMLSQISRGFGPHSPEQWLALSRHMVKPVGGVGGAGGALTLHYDPAIATPFKSVTQDAAEQGEAALWALYDGIAARTLLLRGAESDLLSPETARQMALRGPRATCVEFPGVGHAPTLVQEEQVLVVEQFLTSP